MFSPVCKTVPYGLMAALSRLSVSLYEIMSRIWFFWEPNTALWLPWAPGTWHSLLWIVFLNIFHSCLLPRGGHSWQCHPCQRVIQESLPVSPNTRFSLSGQPLTLHPKTVSRRCLKELWKSLPWVLLALWPDSSSRKKAWQWITSTDWGVLFW